MPITSALAVGIFVGSLALLLLRHRRVPDWSAALGGGVLMVVVGVLRLGDALSQLAASWNAFLFFLGLGLSAAHKPLRRRGAGDGGALKRRDGPAPCS